MADLYSKKVMEYFHHPKNMGEIKDADGIGKVGNPTCGDLMWIYIKVGKNKKGQEIIKDIKVKTFGCLPPQEKIVVGGGNWQEIFSLKKGEEVINDLGKKTVILKTFEIDYTGPILNLVPFVSPFNSFSVTPEHPVLCIKRKWFKTTSQGSNSDWPKIVDQNLVSKKPDFVEANNLEEGDYLVFSFNKNIVNNKHLTRDWVRLIGYYLAEGYITANESVVNFSFNKKEERYISEIKRLVGRITGKTCSQRTRNNVTEVYVCSRKLVRSLTGFAGKYAGQKRLSGEIMDLPPNKQKEIITTFYHGDGDKTIRRKGDSPTFRLATASPNLAIQFQEILARNEIFASIVKRKKREMHFIEGREITGKDLYIVSFKKEREHKFVHARDSSFLVPIKKIEKRNYAGIVYNLHVDKEPNSYLVKGFAVHNCVAAIASSSVTTALVKGKTLEEAEKISKDDVAKALHGLPPIKLHCSVLSIDALRAAIKDYKSKKKK